MTTQLKPTPRFSSEAEEREFWESHDSTEYVDWSKAGKTHLPNLQLSPGTRDGNHGKTDAEARLEHRSITVGELIPMDQEIYAPDESETLNTVAERMSSGDGTGYYSQAPVIDQTGRVTGVVTLMDIVNAYRAGKGKSAIKTVASTKQPATCEWETPVAQVAGTVREEGYALVNRAGQLAGIITNADLP